MSRWTWIGQRPHDGGVGAIYCLLSAACFGTNAIFAKLAYAEGVDVGTLLVLRFGIAAAFLLGLAAARGAFRGLGRRAVLASLGMGALGYTAQAGLYFSALMHIDASYVALVFCIYPILVMVMAVLTGRENATKRRAAALATALGGLALVVGGAAAGAFDARGALLAFGSAVVYTGYILVGDRTIAGLPALPVAALVCTGAFIAFLVGRLVTEGALTPVTLAAGFWMLCLAMVSTVGAILFFFAGLASVGPTMAALLGVLEPVVTVTAAAAVFGETMGPWQVVGGAVVLAAVAVVQWPPRRPRTLAVADPALAVPVPEPPVEAAACRA